jgi:drug/metabolite transporter (DMT)-like permease
MRGRGVTGYLRQHWWRGALAGLISALAYAIVMWAMTLGAIAAVAALRETSVIFAALIGSLALREPFGFKRVAAAALVAAGVILIHAAV